jgi:hypothetical protein
MKTLDLNAYGVKEMNVNEMEKVDGGWWWIVALAVVFLAIDWWQDGHIDGHIDF